MFKSIISNTFSIFPIGFSIVINLYKQKLFIKKKLRPLIEKSYANSSGNFVAGDIRKIENYYALFVPAVLGEAFCALHGEKMTEKERWISTLQSTLSSVGDDFFDKTKIPDFNLNDLEKNLNSLKTKNENEHLFAALFKELKKAPPNKNLFDSLNSVYKAQIRSNLQKNKNTTLKEIEKITANKGGYSFLFYRWAFSYPLENVEKELVFKLGECLQWANDIFDIFEDHKSGIRTVATECNNIEQLTDRFQNKITEIVTLAYKTRFKKKIYRGFSV